MGSLDFNTGPLPFEAYGVTPRQHYIMLAVTLFALIFNIFISRLTSVTQRPPPESKSVKKPADLLVVLGSGGHTTEMLSILREVKGLTSDYNRTYVVSSGDGFSAGKAAEFERELSSATPATGAGSGKGRKGGSKNTSAPTTAGANENFAIHTVTRARRVHQSILTAPFTTLLCLRDCTSILRRNPPDLIITNGPGTGVVVVMASILLRLMFMGSKEHEMRTTFIESWARVKTLSLSGKILIYFVDRFVVQWPALVRAVGKDSVEYVGSLIK